MANEGNDSMATKSSGAIKKVSKGTSGTMAKKAVAAKKTTGSTKNQAHGKVKSGKSTAPHNVGKRGY
jgi:hypothetical protein